VKYPVRTFGRPLASAQGRGQPGGHAQNGSHQHSAKSILACEIKCFIFYGLATLFIHRMGASYATENKAVEAILHHSWCKC
jgi:hypothetical protein